MKDKIKAWLKTQNHTRDWLGEKIGVASKTIDNWLSSPRTIPPGKQKLIERLMQDDEAAEAQRRLQLLPQAQIFSLEVDLPTFRAYSAAALLADQTLEEWAITELNAAAEAAMPEITQRETEIAGRKLKIIGPTKYTPQQEGQTRAAEDPPEV